MKKIFWVLTILAALASQSLVAKADGDVHNPGYYCPDPLVCCSEPTTPDTPGTQCPDDGSGTQSAAASEEGNSQEESVDYLLSLFGF